jgi:hypothetical protein
MRKYIIEYVGGTKGDLITGFLNNTLQLTNINNVGKSPYNLNFSKLKKFTPNHNNREKQNPNEWKMPDKQDFIKVLEQDKFLFINSHKIWFLVDDSWYDIVENCGYTIKRISFDRKYFRDVRIESLFKNSTKYNAESLQFELSKLKENYIHYLRYNKETYRRETWDYESLFKNFEIFNEDPVFKNYDIETYKKLVEKSWLPAEIKQYGKIWYPADYGYLQKF